MITGKRRGASETEVKQKKRRWQKVLDGGRKRVWEGGREVGRIKGLYLHKRNEGLKYNKEIMTIVSITPSGSWKYRGSKERKEESVRNSTSSRA
jgi:hypothetical protein